MNHFAITSNGSLSAIQWPPRWYFFDPSIFDSSGLIPNASRLKEMHTELRNWTDRQLSSSWAAYTRDMGVDGLPVPEHKDLFFLAYLYAVQELGFVCRKLDDLEDLWSKVSCA